MSQPTHSRPDTPLYTIGILTARLNGPNEINLWHGVAERAKEININLIFFSGGIPHWSQLYEAQRNILFNFAGQPNVDGLLVWANILSLTLDPTGLKNFCQRYAPLPVVSMGMVIPSVQSIRIDMQEGMRKLITHMIEEHGRKNIAFIRGPEVSQDAEDRYTAYIETLTDYKIPIDPRLIIFGDFRRYAGTAAIQQLIDTPHLMFDAVVSANDNMAIGALQALQAHGVKVPEDVIVAGFDDIEETRAITPSLTTIRAPWHTLGSKSIDLIISRMKNEPSPEQILLETELVCRQSCGCQQAYQNLNNAPLIRDASRRIIYIPDRASIQTSTTKKTFQETVNEILARLASIRWLDQEIAQKLVNSFIADVLSRERDQNTFIYLLHDTLSSIRSGIEIIEWQEVINLIRSNLEVMFTSQVDVLKAHYLLENGFTLVGEVAHRKQLSERLDTINQTNRLNRIVQTMSTTHDIETLMNLLAAELPRFGIESCFLSLYAEKGDNPAWSRLVLAMVRKQRLPLDRGGIRFPTRQLVPAGFLPKDSQFTFDVEALHFQEEQIGFVMFEIGPGDGEIYTTLQGHISSALKSAELVQVALEAEAKAIKSDQLKTHLLANVSHELRAPLNIILGLSHTALSSPNPYGIELPSQLSKDLGYIFASGEDLIRIINDLLDTSRAEIGELDLSYEPVSPLPLLKEVFETFKGTSIDKQKNVELILDAPEHLPVLHADPVRLRQILMNLLSNAFKFTEAGKVILGADVQLPHVHFWVFDTGSGISPELQERIFEPFIKAGTPGQRRSGIGLGLSITRRLVALHGGSITLDSVPNVGSTFHVYIPLPGLNNAAAQEVELEGASPILLWLSSNQEPPLSIQNICRKNGLIAYWLSSIDDFEQSLRQGKPAAFAWDLENARPGDWSIVQKLRTHPQYCQLPLLLFHENIVDKLFGASRLTNVLLKPAGSQMLQHVLNLLPEALKRGEIWIIDDDPQALKYYQDLISRSLSEFLVRLVRGGREALRLLEDETPDLVLLDLIMPDIDGFQVLEQLRNNVKTAHIPVIVITGKILSYEDVKRLDVPKVILQTKGVLSDEESLAEIQRVLTANSALPQPTSMVVKNASAYIQQNYTRSFSLEEVSATIGVSKSYLSRIFKMEMGISPWEYLNRFRTQKAKELLLLTDDSITTISADVGYEDVGYFGRVFREITGSSPRVFRQQHKAFRTG